MAGHLGYTVARLEREISSAELTEWMAADLLDPIGSARTLDGLRGIMALLYNANRTPKAKAAEPSEFIPVWRPQETIDAEAKLARAREWFERMAERGNDG